MKIVTAKTHRGLFFAAYSIIVTALLLFQGCPSPSIDVPPEPARTPQIDPSNPKTGPPSDASKGAPITDSEGRIIATIIIQHDAASGTTTRKLTISKGVTAVRAFAFRDLLLTSVIIPDSVNSIGPRAFEGNLDLKSVNISQSLLNDTNPNAFPAGFTFFKDSAGKHITSKLRNKPVVEDSDGSKITVTVDAGGKTVFKDLEVSPALTTIAADKFADMKFTSVLIPVEVTAIGAGAFRGSPGLKSVTLSKKLLNTFDVDMPAAAAANSVEVNFQTTGASENPNFPPGVVFTNHRGRVITPRRKMPITTDAEGSVTTITRAKNGTGRILAKSLRVSSQLTVIPANKFANRELTEVIIPASTTKIDKQAFANNPNLKSVTISQGLLNDTPVGTFPAGTVFKDHSGTVITRETVQQSAAPETTERIPGPEGFVTIVVKDASGTVISKTLETASSVRTINNRQFKDKELTHINFIAPSSLISIRGYAFANNKLTTVIIPDLVVDIDEYAFAHNRITSLTMSNWVTDIGESAFRGNRLTSLTIPDSVTVINQFAFADNQIAGLTIGNAVNTIGNYAFDNNRLTSLTIPSSVTSIGDKAFAVNRLTSLSIPNSITSIEASTFRNNSLAALTIPNSVTSIKSNAFANNSLTSLTIPNSVISIEAGAFRSNRLTTLTISNSLNSIGAYSFADNRLTSLTIPNSVTSIQDKAFAANPNLKSITISQKLLNDTPIGAFPAGAVFKDHNENVITRWVTERTPGPNGFVTIVVKDGNNAIISKTLEVASSVTSITDRQSGAGLFQGKNLTHVNFIAVSSLNSIGSSAFENNSLTSLTIPNSVTSIGADAFRSNRLSTVTIPNSVTSIGAGAFENNRLTSLTIPNSVTSIGANAFAANPDLKSITISQERLNATPAGAFPAGAVFKDHSAAVITRWVTERTPGPNGFVTILVKDGNNAIISKTLEVASSVTSITDRQNGAGLFQGKNLTHVNFIAVSSLNSIGSSAFENNRLTSLTIPNSVTSIGAGAFRSNLLTSLTIPNAVTSIGAGAFKNNRLTSLIIPNSVTSIGAGAFRSNLLTEVTIPNAVTSIGANAFRSNRLTEVTIPNAVTSIGANAFENNSLTSLTIPNSVTSIGTGAFHSNLLTTVTIPNAVTSIRAGAFENNRLTSLTIPNSVTSIGAGAFRSNLLTTVTIPNAVTSIGANAFENNRLTSLTIPNLVTSIGAGAFHSNRLTTVTIPNSVTSIGAGAFHSNLLTTVTIPNSVTSIGANTFENNSLTSLTIPNSVTSIGAGAFRSNRLTTVTIPNSVTSIRAGAFENNRLTSLTIPNSVTSIGDKAFAVAANPDIKSITISQELLNDTPTGAFPAGAVFKDHSGKVITRWVTERIPGPNGFVTILVKDGNNAIISKTLEVASSVTSTPAVEFSGKRLTHVNFITPSSLINIGMLSFEDNRIDQLTIPNSVKYIHMSAFEKNLINSLVIPNSVTEIGHSAFRNNSLKSLTIPNSVTRIDYWAFSDNPLTTVTISQTLLNRTPSNAFPSSGVTFKDHSGNTITRPPR